MTLQQENKFLPQAKDFLSEKYFFLFNHKQESIWGKSTHAWGKIKSACGESFFNRMNSIPRIETLNAKSFVIRVQTVGAVSQF